MENEANQLIAIVDDDESVREATTGLLRSNGLAAEAFSSAEEFLISSLLVKTRCLLLDLRMPRTSGLELQRRLAGGARRFPIIIITACDEPEIRLQAMQAGAIDFLPKPFSESALLGAVHNALKHHPNENYDDSH